MKPGTLNTLHRNVGIVLAPFLLLQGMTGLLLSLDNAGTSAPLSEGALLYAAGWQRMLITIHFGPGLIHNIYLMLLFAAILWMIATGSSLFIRGHRARAAAAAAREIRSKGGLQP